MVSSPGQSGMEQRLKQLQTRQKINDTYQGRLEQDLGQDIQRTFTFGGGR